MILRRGASCVLPVALLAACVFSAPSARAQRNPPAPEFPAPIAVYSHESESAAPALNEALALRDVDQLLRLKRSGVRFDYDLIDASWFTPGSDRNAASPNGAGAWIARCRAAGIRPGLRFVSNSSSANGRAPALFEGSFLPDFVAALQTWYNHGIRLFEFDAFDLTAATPAAASRLTEDQIVARNTAALRLALQAFRAKNRDVLLLTIDAPATRIDPPAPTQPDPDPPAAGPAHFAEAGRLGAFTLLSPGPLSPSAMPQPSFRRAIDIESDDRVRRLEQSGIPLAQIHSAGFRAAPVGSSGSQAPSPAADRGWKSAFLLALARGGWVNTVHGNLKSIQPADARWMARAQKLFFALQATGQMHSFGAPPGSGLPYGFAGTTAHGSVYLVVNPSQTVATLALPQREPNRTPEGAGCVQFHDAGFVPRLAGNSITLGPGQVALVGYGAFATPEFAFGVDRDVVIPSSIQPLHADFQSTAPGVLEVHIDPPMQGVLRIIAMERSPGGDTPPDAPADAPAAEASGQGFTIEITQNGRSVPVRLDGADSESGNSLLSAGPSWAVAEIDVYDLTPGVALSVRFRENDTQPIPLEGRAYQVDY